MDAISAADSFVVKDLEVDVDCGIGLVGGPGLRVWEGVDETSDLEDEGTVVA